jgi:hypothetical protein
MITSAAELDTVTESSPQPLGTTTVSNIFSGGFRLVMEKRGIDQVEARQFVVLSPAHHNFMCLN